MWKYKWQYPAELPIKQTASVYEWSAGISYHIVTCSKRKSTTQSRSRNTGKNIDKMDRVRVYTISSWTVGTHCLLNSTFLIKNSFLQFTGSSASPHIMHHTSLSKFCSSKWNWSSLHRRNLRVSRSRKARWWFFKACSASWCCCLSVSIWLRRVSRFDDTSALWQTKKPLDFTQDCR